MIKNIKKLVDKIIDHTSDIVFGILSGAGLSYIVIALVTLIEIYLPILESYFLIIFFCLYFFILVSTSIYYAKGWFRIIYVVSSLILSFVYIYTKIFGAIQ